MKCVCGTEMKIRVDGVCVEFNHHSLFNISQRLAENYIDEQHEIIARQTNDAYYVCPKCTYAVRVHSA